MRRSTALTATAISVLLLGACTGADDASQGTPTPAASASGESSAPASAPTADAGDDEPVAGGVTEDCLLGTWQLDMAAMQDDLRGLFTAGGDAQGAVEVSVDGTAAYEFAAGGGFGADVDSTSQVTMSADGSELTSTAASTGDLTGRWSLAGDQLTISDIDSSGLEVTTTGTLDGEELDVPEGSAEDAIEALPPTVSTATCSTGTLTLRSTLQADEDSEPVTLTHTLRR